MGRKKKVEAVTTVTTPSIDNKIEYIEAVNDPETDLVVIPHSRGVVPRGPFKYERLSASMMKTWLSCKKKFYHQYVEGIKSPGNDSFSLGTAVHAGLEAANRDLQVNPRELNPIEVEQYVQAFRDTLAKSTASDMGQFSIGEDLVRTELTTVDWQEKLIGIELEFDQVTAEGVRIYGFIDKVTEIDVNTIKVTDYKTSKNPMSYDDSRLDPQLAMYDLAINTMFPQYNNILLEFKYLRTGDSVVITKSPIERHNFRRQLMAVDKAIKEFTTTITQAPDGNLNEFCSWCTYKSNCSKYKDLTSTILPDFPQVTDIDDSSFVDMWERVANITKAAEAWKDQLKLWVAVRMEQSPDISITNGKKEVYTLSTTRREYDPVKIGKLIGLPDLLGASTKGVPLIKINNKAIETYLRTKGNRNLEAKIEQAADIKFNSFQIRTKKA